jgi:hypothetical protein
VGWVGRGGHATSGGGTGFGGCESFHSS